MSILSSNSTYAGLCFSFAQMSKYMMCICIVMVLSISNVFAMETLSKPTGKVLLTVKGQVTNTNDASGAIFDMPMLLELGTQSFVTHTPWSDVTYKFKGIAIKDILKAVGASKSSTIKLKALDDYQVVVPWEDLIPHNAILAFSRNNVPLTRRDRGPLWLVFPRDANEILEDSKFDNYWVWQLLEIEVQ